MRQQFFAWMSEMTDAAGDDLNDRLWSYTTPPDPNASAVDIRSVGIMDGFLEVEYDAMEGWLTNGAAFEATDNLASNNWTSVTPDSFVQLDRFLDQGTYRAVFPAEESRRT